MLLLRDLGEIKVHFMFYCSIYDHLRTTCVLLFFIF